MDCSFDFYFGDELRYMNLDGQDDPYTFQLSMWEIYLQNDGDPPYRLYIFLILIVVVWEWFFDHSESFHPIAASGRSPSESFCGPGCRSSWFGWAGHACMSLDTWCHPSIAPQQEKWLAETLELFKVLLFSVLSELWLLTYLHLSPFLLFMQKSKTLTKRYRNNKEGCQTISQVKTVCHCKCWQALLRAKTLPLDFWEAWFGVVDKSFRDWWIELIP